MISVEGRTERDGGGYGFLRRVTAGEGEEEAKELKKMVCEGRGGEEEMRGESGVRRRDGGGRRRVGVRVVVVERVSETLGLGGK